MAKQSSYNIIEATVIMSSTEGTNTEVDIRNSVIEFQTFEHIQKPYIDGRIVFIDDFGLRDTLSMSGTERLRIVLANEEDIQDTLIVKYFFFSKINDTKKLNERSELLSADLVEEHLFVDSVKQFSRSYTAKIEDIITDICFNELKKNVVPYKFEGSAQGVRKVIVPYMSPLEAVSWVRDRATTRTGSPIYLYPSLFTDNLFISDLDSLMKEEVINAKFPLQYSTASQSIDQSKEDLKAYSTIISYKEQENNNMMALFEEGGIGSYYSSIDAGSGVTNGSHISVRDIIDEFYTNNIISPETAQTVYDPSLVIDGKLSDEYNSVNIFQVTSAGTYNQFLSYHDESTLLDDTSNIVESRLKVKNKVIRSILKKNVIDIGMEGKMFLESQAMVGNRLRLLFISPNVNLDDKDLYSQLDKRKSGDYFILGMSHMFRDKGHTVSLRLTKIGELPKDYSL
jgi:hypothetical protein